MKLYRVYFKKDGINLTKLVYANSVSEIFMKFNKFEIVLIKEIDSAPEQDIDTISLN